MEKDFPAQASNLNVRRGSANLWPRTTSTTGWFACRLKFLARLSAVFALIALPVAAQQIQLFVGTNAITNGQMTPPVDFGSVLQNQAGSNVTFTVTDTDMGKKLALLSITMPPGYMLNTNPPFTIINIPFLISNGMSGTFGVQFDSTVPGTNLDDITIVSSDPTNSPFTFAVTGFVTARTISLGGSLAFGFVVVDASAQSTLTISNAGDLPLTVSNLTYPAGFSGPWSGMIPAGNSQPVTVTFSPTLATNYSGLVTVNSDATSGTNTIPISGSGLPISKIISLSGNLALDPVATNSSSQRTLTISNAGNSTLTVSNLTYPAGFSGPWSGMIPASNSQTVTVTFSPTLATNYSGLVTVNSDATSGTNTIPISGFGASPNLFLTVITNGYGTVAPIDTARALRANTKYRLTATAKTGNVFSNWTGSITTNANPLTFTMATNMVLEANFVTNPFRLVNGTYNGLFTATNGVIDEQTAGMLKGLLVRPNGTYSGALLIYGASHAVSGTFSLAGLATNLIARPLSQGGQLLLEMTLAVNTAPPLLTGMVSGTNTNHVTWVSTNLMADLATNIPASAEYTLVIPPDPNNASSNLFPGGDGYALITNHASTVKITGALADGTAFSQSVPVSPEGDVPLYANLYGNKGLLLGWINLAATNPPGAVVWVHPAIRTGLFTNAFTTTNPIALSPWTNPPVISAPPTNLIVVEMVNGIATQTNAFGISVGSNLKLTETPSGSTPVTGSINPKTGLLTVSIGKGEFKITGSGAILLNATNGTNGGGYFLTRTNSGAVIFEP